MAGKLRRPRRPTDPPLIGRGRHMLLPLLRKNPTEMTRTYRARKYGLYRDEIYSFFVRGLVNFVPAVP